MEAKLKHLEFIQQVIVRMNSNSFMIKGWAITIIAALFALSAKDSNKAYVIIAYLPLFPFWILDSFYLSKERQYRKLYDAVRIKNENEIDFSMDTNSFNVGNNTWFNTVISKTLCPFYGLLLILTIIIMFLII